MPLKLSKETEALLALVKPPNEKITSGETDQLYEHVTTLNEMLKAVEDRLNAIMRGIRSADATEEEPNGYIYFEALRGKVTGALREAQAMALHMHQLTDACFEIDQYGATMNFNVETHDERMADNARRAARVVHLNGDEADALRKRAEDGDAALRELNELKEKLLSKETGK